MLTLIRHLLLIVRTSFWFVPALLVAGAFVGAFLMVWVDGWMDLPENGLLERLVYSGDADGVRSILSTIAGAMMTIAGVVFSLTMITLTMASSQFGPRLIRNFMKSRGNQIVLGTFIATFIYCLLVLLMVHNSDEAPFVPGLAVSFAVLVAVINSAMLVWFIHHVASAIQADLVVADVGGEFADSLAQIYPEHFSYELRALDGFDPGPATTRVRAAGGHYLHAIRAETLVDLACEKDMVLSLLVRPGKMLMPNAVLAIAHGPERLSDSDQQTIRDAFLTGPERTDEQDTEFTINQLVEVALRALSPGINDPFTALSCIDHLAAGLCRVGQRDFPGGLVVDGDGQPRLLVQPLTFEGLFHSAFDQLRQIAPAHPVIAIRLLERLNSLAACLEESSRLSLVEQAGQSLAEQCREQFAYQRDREVIDQRLDALLSTIKDPKDSPSQQEPERSLGI
ncbi:MAG: DUF2254 domain-containing protein [Wenzhouxiangella sp.]